ncbi:MAG: cytochrome P450 [Actinobacteria bacterium]|nr:cytochrome P450 [Actinomycetota bacterium]
MGQHKRVAVIAPMKREMQPIIKMLELTRTGEQGGMPVYTGWAGDVEVVLTGTGVGPARATTATERLLSTTTVDRVIVSGIAGGLAPASRVLDMVVPEEVVDSATGERFRSTPFGGVTVSGVIHTGDGASYEFDDGDVERLVAEAFTALDMETAAIARVCERHGVPWLAFRVVSDMAGDNSLGRDVMALVHEDGTPKLGAAIRYMLTHPRRIPLMLRVGRDAQAAAAAAARAAVANLKEPAGAASSTSASSSASTSASRQQPPEGPIDLLSGDLYDDVARRTHAWMRRHAPVYFDEKNELWGIATYDAVRAASKDSDTFSNAGGSRPKLPPMPWMIDLDGTDHVKRRKLVSGGFTPPRVKEQAPRIARLCDDLINTVCERGECDLVRDLAAPLPMIVIGDMLGVAPEDRDQLLSWSDDLIGSLDPSPGRLEAAAEAFAGFDAYARRTIDARREQPTDDLVSVLVHAEVDGDRLTDDEIVFESMLILLGGDETTRHVISGGIEQLLHDPSERRPLEDDPSLLASAVEEMLRWVSPIKNMARTVTTDVELAGTQLREGDEVVLLYESANFDEAQFNAPQNFDITRSPNDHLAFGFGRHLCLGAALARVEIQAMVGRVLTRLPDLELASTQPPERFLGALRSLPVRFTPTTPIG